MPSRPQHLVETILLFTFFATNEASNKKPTNKEKKFNVSQLSKEAFISCLIHSAKFISQDKLANYVPERKILILKIIVRNK